MNIGTSMMVIAEPIIMAASFLFAGMLRGILIIKVARLRQITIIILAGWNMIRHMPLPTVNNISLGHGKACFICITVSKAMLIIRTNSMASRIVVDVHRRFWGNRPNSARVMII